jgi:hypothetical protein
VLGVVLAQWRNELLHRQVVGDGDAVLALPMDLRVLAFALVASSLSGLAFGLVPAWLASHTDVNEALKQGSRGTTGDRSQHRVQHALIIAEVALALMLLVGAGLVVNGLRGFAALDPGWRVDGMTLGYLTLPEAKYGDGNRLRAFADRIEERLLAIPGVERAAICWNLPVRQFNVTSSFGIDGRPEPPKGAVQDCSVNGITPGTTLNVGGNILVPSGGAQGQAFLHFSFTSGANCTVSILQDVLLSGPSTFDTWQPVSQDGVVVPAGAAALEVYAAVIKNFPNQLPYQANFDKLYATPAPGHF